VCYKALDVVTPLTKYDARSNLNALTKVDTHLGFTGVVLGKEMVICISLVTKPCDKAS
jgi:hypothetical protein